jgi:hypothetical protein
MNTCQLHFSGKERCHRAAAVQLQVLSLLDICTPVGYAEEL